MKFKAEWFNDEDFWSRYAPVIFDDKRWSEAGGLADSITRLSRLKLYDEDNSAGNGAEPRIAEPLILDLCCGMGRLTSEFARRGFAATGVDITAALLETARDDAVYEGLDIEYVQADARSFKRTCYYDTAVNLYISFGYFEDPADDLLMARNVYESLKPGGCFIIETLGKEIAVRDFTSGEWFERAGYTVLTEYEALDSWAKLKNRWILIPNPQVGGNTPARIEKTFCQRLYAATELRSLLITAGFNAVEIYGGWDERPYDQNAEVLIAAGRK